VEEKERGNCEEIKRCRETGRLNGWKKRSKKKIETVLNQFLTRKKTHVMEIKLDVMV